MHVVLLGCNALNVKALQPAWAVQALQQAGETLWLLCLTTGNYDGLGKQRTMWISGSVIRLDHERRFAIEFE